MAPTTGGPSIDAADNVASGTAAEGGAAEAPPQVLSGKTVGVVGGGPGGMLCAAHLARLGASVEVFERRALSPSAANYEPPAVWNIFLGPGSKKTIEAAGISSDFGPRWRPEGIAVYRPGAPPHFTGPWVAKDGAPNGVARATQRGIVEHLTAETQRVYGDSVTVTNGVRVVGGRVCEGEVVLEDGAGERTTRQFDVVVGADGYASTVRDLMQEQDSDLRVEVARSSLGIVCTLVDSPGHPSTFSTLPTPSGTPFQAVPDGYEGALDGCISAFAMNGAASPASLGFCVMAIRHGGSEVSLAITGEARVLREARSEEELRGMLEAAYPYLPTTWLQQAAELLHDRAIADDLRIRVPTFVKCSKIASGRAILIGDAAHAVSPNIGMGCTAALQDSEVLSRACVATGGDVGAAAREYAVMRGPSVEAMTHVSQRIDAVQGFKYHRNPVKALIGLPYYIVSLASNPARAQMPAFLKPGFSFSQTFNTEEDWSGLKARVRWYSAKLAAVSLGAVAAAAATAAAAWSLASSRRTLPAPR